MTLRNQLAALLTRWAARLAAVTAVDPGRDSDGLIELYAGGPADRPWAERQQQFTDALAAWRSNPLTRRVITLITSFVVGDGITLRAEYGPLQRYLTAWWQHPQNLLDLRLTPWCEELSRAGELFIALHFNPADGISYCRLVPAASIDAITWAPGDYEQELTYHEAVGLEDPDYDKGGRTWYAPDPTFDIEHSTSNIRPVMLHFAVNRPAGCVRGDSDLATILTWLQYYAAWLSDRVKLNEAVRAFLWIVKVTGTNVDTRKRQLKNKPEPGTVQVIDKDNEDWQAVAPNLNANDAAQDGRAIRWMIAAGGPGVSLVDFGESETANLATATAMAEQRNKFMKTRQAYFGYVLSRLAIESYNPRCAWATCAASPRTSTTSRPPSQTSAPPTTPASPPPPTRSPPPCRPCRGYLAPPRPQPPAAPSSAWPCASSCASPASSPPPPSLTPCWPRLPHRNRPNRPRPTDDPR